jgi:hypothetical protein
MTEDWQNPEVSCRGCHARSIQTIESRAAVCCVIQKLNSKPHGSILIRSWKHASPSKRWTPCWLVCPIDTCADIKDDVVHLVAHLMTHVIDGVCPLCPDSEKYLRYITSLMWSITQIDILHYIFSEIVRTALETSSVSVPSASRYTRVTTSFATTPQYASSAALMYWVLPKGRVLFL